MDRPSLWSVRALLALGVAVAGAAVAIAVSGADGKPAATAPSTQPPTATTVVTTAPPPITTAPPPVTTAPPPVTTAPPPVTTAPPPATRAWPAGREGWTIVLVSLPEGGGRGAAEAQARRARAASLPDAGVLRSSDFTSLNPGYYVVFAGVFDSLDAATRALPDARAAFSTAYTRRVAH
ncbi:MAG: SPOR domain-containing protein [Actinobacteria bacterium]|nr:SPOR domain-containing protein [Actinomycetota bacterium]